MRWDEDACTVLRPADTSLPAAAFRDDRPPTSSGLRERITHDHGPDCSRAKQQAEPRGTEVGVAAPAEGELEPGADAPKGASASARTLAPSAARVPLPAVRPRVGRWILLGIAVVAFCAGTYVAVRVSQRLGQQSSRQAPAPESSGWEMLADVIDEARVKLAALW